MIQRILAAIAKWSLARLRRSGKLPAGLPGHRDPDNRCDVYTPKRVKDAFSHFRDCQGDGHYLCKGCVHRAPEVVECEHGYDEEICPICAAAERR